MEADDWEEERKDLEKEVSLSPGSYKIWRKLLQKIRQECKNLSPDDIRVVDANEIHEKAFVFLHRMRFYFFLKIKIIIHSSLVDGIYSVLNFSEKNYSNSSNI
jgi:hypothetical protein